MEIFDVFGSMRIIGDTQVNNALQSVGRGLDNVGKKLIGFGTGLTLGATVPIVGLIGKSVELASNLEESMNVVNVTFSKTADEVTQWSKTLKEKYGMVQLESMKYVGSMGAMLKSSGLSVDASKKMSTSLVELTGDMSSFYNLSHEETWEKIRSGISGETEPLKALGINMSVANLEAYALSVGINKAWKEMSQAEQVTLRYNYLMKVTADAQGDFSRTSEGFANQLRIVQGSFEELGIKIGTVLLPVVTIVVQKLNNLLDTILKLPDGSQNFILIAGLIAASLGPLMVVAGFVASSLAGIVTALTALSLPALAAILAFLELGIVLGVFGGIIGGILYTTGALEKILTGIKNITSALIDIFQGNLSEAMQTLTQNFGMSGEEAGRFVTKVANTRDEILKLIDNVKNITGLLKAIFTGDSQAMMDLLTEKFGISTSEAKKLVNMTLDTIRRLKDLADTALKTSAGALSDLIDTIGNLISMLNRNKSSISSIITVLNGFAQIVIWVAEKVIKYWGAMATAVKISVGVITTEINILKGIIKGLLSPIESVINAFSRLEGKKSAAKGIEKAIPKYATGIINAAAGHLAIVGEQGPELMYVPKTANIYSNTETKRMLSSGSSSGSNINPATNNQSKTENYYIDKIVLDTRNISEINDIINIFRNLKMNYVTR